MRSALLRILLTAAFIFFIQASFAAVIFKNPAGKVTLVEYYDYECPHCRRMQPVIESLEKEYANLHMTYRVTPLLTRASRDIANIALAVKSQNKKSGLEFHRALMSFNSTPTVADAIHIATALDLSKNALFYTMQSYAIQNHINQNIALANTYAINGVIYLPIFVFSKSSGWGQSIVLRGEQSRMLLSAIIRQLGDQHVPAAKEKKANK